MDWAIFRIEDTAPLHLLPKLLSQHSQGQSDLDNELIAALDTRPGAPVVSVGRTSGYQTGKISPTLSCIFHEDYVTQEWCVIKREDTSVEEWVEGGIGVEGDSGALIVDEMTKEIYGMLWGRTGDGAATATIFTPLQEIFEDIKSAVSTAIFTTSEEIAGDFTSRYPSYSQPRVEILKGQQMPGPFLETELSLPIGGSIPPVPILVQTYEKDEKTADGAALIPGLVAEGRPIAPIPTAPISIHPGGKEDDYDQPLAQALSSLSLTPPSSTSLGRRLPFERYRGHNRSISDQDVGLDRATPRQEQEGKVDSKSWPGIHTYLRYALGDQG
jgi:hypothetical protein